MHWQQAPAMDASQCGGWCREEGAKVMSRSSGSCRHPQKSEGTWFSCRYSEADGICHNNRTRTAVTLGTLGLVFQWGSSLNLLGANNSDTVLILFEHVMSAHYGQQVAAVQLTPKQLSITQFSSGAHLALQSDIHVKGVCATKVGVALVLCLCCFSCCCEADYLLKIFLKKMFFFVVVVHL